MSAPVFVVPGGIDDPSAPSGGNAYDRRLSAELARAGRPLRELPVDGAWPDAGPDGCARLARALEGLPDGTVVLMDGLVACGVPEVSVPAAARLRLAVLVHLPLADETGPVPEHPAAPDVSAAPGSPAAPTRPAGPESAAGPESPAGPGRAAVLERGEGEVLRAAERVVATSGQAAQDLARRHGLDPARVHAVEPGTDRAPLAAGTDGASRILCVASVTPRKGHDLLAEALSQNRDQRWECVCAGPEPRTAPSGPPPGGTPRDGAPRGGTSSGGAPFGGPSAAEASFGQRVRRRLERSGLDGRVPFTGPLGPAELDREYARADLAVLPSRAETFGMAAAEALARGVPVLASRAGALPATVGRVPDGRVPGLLVPPEDATALGAALARWLRDADLRDRLRAAARARRTELRTWESAARDMAGVLDRLGTDRSSPEEAR